MHKILSEHQRTTLHPQCYSRKVGFWETTRRSLPKPVFEAVAHMHKQTDAFTLSRHSDKSKPNSEISKSASTPSRFSM